MSSRPFKRYRPTETSDGEYGWEESLAGPVTVYGAVGLHETETVFRHHRDQDIEVGDILESMDGAQYNVTGFVRPTGGLRVEARIERRDKPINPGE